MELSMQVNIRFGDIIINVPKTKDSAEDIADYVARKLAYDYTSSRGVV